MTGEVDVESWWNYLERKIVEGIAFKDIEQEKIEAVNIAPWIPPAGRGHVVNTEYLKSNASRHRSPPLPVGCPKTLASLICEGVYDPLNLGSVSIAQLKAVCDSVQIPKELATTKVRRVF